MLSVRDTMGFIVAVALGVAIGMFVQARQTSNPSAHYSLAVVEFGDRRRSQSRRGQGGA